ncbi:MAG: Gfo/Idh/MocA family oxidoreductase [Clostridia bacterium]
MKSINLAIIGVGCRGYSWINEVLKFENVTVTAVCDKYEDRVERAIARINEKKDNLVFGTTDYKEVLIRDDVDMVMVASSWDTHSIISIDSMKAGKFTCMEVGGAYSLEECWELVHTWEETKTPFFFMENCCFGQYETMVLNMVKKGLFGEIVYCEGGYCHDLRKEVAEGKIERHYRLEEYLSRNCENYPTHELGPIAKVLGINNGNRFVSLRSVVSGSKGMDAYIKENMPDDEYLKGKTFAQADIVKTFITCENGETITITLDTTLPRFYSRGFTVRGTKAMYFEDTNTVYFDKEHEKYDFNARPIWDNATQYAKEHCMPYWENPEELKKSGHGGMDYVLFKAMVDAYLTGDYPAVDIYDAAAWMAITALSTTSIQNGGKLVDVPDFTCGKYKNRTETNNGIYAL